MRPALRRNSATTRRIVLEVVSSPDASAVGRRLEVGRATAVIGRDFVGVGLLIDDRRLSRVHAHVTFDPDATACRITDAGSKNGCFADAERIESALASDGAVLRVGDTVLVVLAAGGRDELDAQIRGVAGSSAPVLLRGEPGTMMESVARAIHEARGRPGELVVGAEVLANANDGASGASRALKGLLRSAGGGTLFVDVIDRGSPEVQDLLVHAIDEQRERRAPGRQARRAGVHFVVASEAPAPEAVTLGLNEALLARLEAVVTVPPLRARRGEVLATASALGATLGRTLSFTPDAAEALVGWSWPSNARELHDLVRSFVLATEGDAPLDLPYLDEGYPAIAAPIVGRRDSAKKAVSSAK
jgi:transcriptional regulator of acetoin/glycerol metabolism